MSMDRLVDLLHTPGAGYTLVVAPADGSAPLTFTRRGVADLLGLLSDKPAILRGASIADKVVGKAAASLMILGGVAALHTDVISRPALDLFSRHPGAEVSYDTVADYVINRTNTGMCPLETRCLNLSTPTECRDAIISFINSQTR